MHYTFKIMTSGQKAKIHFVWRYIYFVLHLLRLNTTYTQDEVNETKYIAILTSSVFIFLV